MLDNHKSVPISFEIETSDDELDSPYIYWIPNMHKEKKKEIWPSPMTKPPIPTENSKTKGQHTNATKNFDYTTIADRLRTVSWSNKWSNWFGYDKTLYTNRKFENQRTTHKRHQKLRLHIDYIQFKHRFIAGPSKCTTTPLSILLTKLLTHIKQCLQNYCEIAYSRSGINQMWILQNSKEL